MAIDVSALRAAGLSDAQIVAVFEKAEELRKARNRERQAEFQARKRANAPNTDNANNVSNVNNVISVSDGEASRACSNTNLPSEDISNIPPLPPKLEKRESRQRGHRLPKTWAPSADVLGFARSLGFTDDLERRERESFFDFWLAIPGAKGCKLDWDMTYRNRLRDMAGRMKLKPLANVLPFVAGADPPKLSAEEQRRRAEDFDRRWKAGEFK
jgi:hypothetical protein